MSKKHHKQPLNSNDEMFLKFTYHIINNCIDVMLPEFEDCADLYDLEMLCNVMSCLVKLAKYLIWDSNFQTDTKNYKELFDDLVDSMLVPYECDYGYYAEYDTYIEEELEECIDEFIRKIKG